MPKNKDTFNFLLVGHWSSLNRGSEAILRSTVSILREEFTNAQITVAALYPEDEAPLANDIPGLQIIPGLNRISSVLGDYPFPHTLLKLIRRILPGGVLPLHDAGTSLTFVLPQARPKSETGFFRVRHLKQAMLDADAVILICADLYNVETYFPSIYAMEVMEYAQLLGRKTVIWCASIWKFKRRWIEKRVKDILLKADLITARDETTMKYLSSLGVKKNLILAADPAFLLQPKYSNKTHLPWILKPRLVVGFSGSDYIYYHLSKRKPQVVIADMLNFFQSLIDGLGSNIVFIPHDGYPGSQEREFLFELALMINRPSNIYMVPVGLDAAEMKGVIGQCDIFIGMRLHATIAALSQCIPTLGLYCSPKVSGLHLSIFGRTDYLMHYNDISLDGLKQKFTQILENKDQIRLQLLKRVPELQLTARAAGRQMRDLK